MQLKYLKSILDYNPETGNWTWLVDRYRRRLKGKKAGTKRGGPYWRIKIDGEIYQAHILAWFYMTGSWPEKEIDHRNTDKHDNKWENLREATRIQNRANRPKQKNNTSGLKGISWNRSLNKWYSQIQHNNKKINLGNYDCPAAAHFNYVIAADKFNREFAHG